MSEIINNREYRQKVLKELIGQLHHGKSAEEVKARFQEAFEGVSATEISEVEQALMAEGMPITEVQRLCDVHAAVFKGIKEIHAPQDTSKQPGHPIQTFQTENREIEKWINEHTKPHLQNYLTDSSWHNLAALRDDVTRLYEIDKHYLRKENLLFPYMEKYGITAPPKVMWGVDDEIRGLIKDATTLLSGENPDRQGVQNKLNTALDKISEMIFKEEKILFPMVAETLSEDEWSRIAQESGEIGYSLIADVPQWKPVKAAADIRPKPAVQPITVQTAEGQIRFETGVFAPAELEAMLNTLPFDITFVDKEGTVKYFSQGKERIFPRTKAIIGRKVGNCHPPASVHIVEEIVTDLQSGRKEHEDFWLKMGGKYVYIRYYAVRNREGEFLGVMEVSQDIAPVQEITGEKRLVSE